MLRGNRTFEKFAKNAIFKMSCEKLAKKYEKVAK